VQNPPGIIYIRRKTPDKVEQQLVYSIKKIIPCVDTQTFKNQYSRQRCLHPRAAPGGMGLSG
jgi:hypothetical protein